MNSFDELCKKLSQNIDEDDTRSRSRTEQEQIRFDYAVKYLLTELWKKHHTHEECETSIQKNKNYYSALAKYRDSNLTYRMAIQAFDGLQKLDMIYVTKNGFYDRTTMEGNLTRFKATDKLRELFNDLEGHPAIVLKPNLDVQTIILRNRIDGRRTLVSYKEDKDTELWRANLKKINGCFARHILDLRIQDKEFIRLQERLLGDIKKEPIDYTRKVLVRIFTNNSFEQGGRFYRGWWQNVPSEYRQFITIDSKKTQEHDYSQLNPNMIYSLYNKELGSEDAYSRVAGEDHRDIVKQAFNAMFQASTTLEGKPEGIELEDIGMSWKEIKQAILEAHKPIKDLFFTGLGNKLQFADSCIAESVMLQFAKMDAPALPVHDSFIMHHGFGSYGELEEAMRRAYYERFNTDINVKKELVVEHKPELPTKDDGSASPDVDDILDAESEYSSWRDRDRMWLHESKNPM